MKRKFLVLLALLVLLMAACTEQTPVVTTEPTTTTVPATTLPLATDIYAEAVSTIGENVTLKVTAEKDMTVGNSEFHDTEELSITYIGLGSDQLAARVKSNISYSGYDSEVSELYQSGVVYTTYWSGKFSQEMPQEDFLARYVPAILLDASLYETVTMEGDTITFADATALESWLEGELITATGTATVTDGALTGYTYNATYKVGASEHTLSLTQTVSPAASTNMPEIKAEDYTAVESVDAIALLEQVYGYLSYAQDLSFRASERVLSHAAAYTYGIQTSIETWRSGDDPMIQVEQDISDMDYNTNRSYDSNVLEVFRDGKYTRTQDDGRPAPDGSVNLGIMTTYYRNILVENVMSPEFIKTATITDVSGAYLAEFTLNDEFGNDICAEVCQTIFGDANLLNKAASKYENKELTCYVAVDKYSGLPTGMGYYYEGSHTLDGRDYPLTRQVDCYIDAASLDAYEAITEKPSPDKENEGATPLLYHVTGADGQEMWLFGTIHVGDDRTGSLPQELYDAFAASDALAIECNTKEFDKQVEKDDALSEKVSDCYFYGDGSLAKDHVTNEELYNDAISMAKASGGHHANVPYLKPYMIGSSLDNFYLRLGYHLTSDKGAESRLMLLAEEQEKPILEVESSLFQIQMMTGYSDALQEMLLEENVYTDPLAYWASVDELYALWCAGDEAALIEELKDDTSEMTEEELVLYNEYNKAMMIDRNDGMLNVARQYLESGDVVFYAVGLAHLLDTNNGLVFTLRDAGYTVTLVEYK